MNSRTHYADKHQSKPNRRFGFVTPSRIISGIFVSSTNDTALRGLIDDPWMSHQCENGQGVQKKKLIDMNIKNAFVYNIQDGHIEFRTTTSINKENIMFTYVIEPQTYQTDKEKKIDSKTQRGTLIASNQELSRIDVGPYSLKGICISAFKYLLDPTQTHNRAGYAKKFDPHFISLSQAQITKVPKSHLEIILKNTNKKIQGFKLGSTILPALHMTKSDQEKLTKTAQQLPQTTIKTHPLQKIFGMHDDFIIFNRNYREGSY